jgi:pimeloyl-ACP methyl ester carboxylesterase
MPTRRTLLAAAASAAAVSVFPAKVAAAMQNKAAFLLVHGAWLGAWCWRDTIPLLTAAGHAVHAVTLTGLGDRAHLGTAETDCNLHTRDVIAAAEAEELDGFILVGHSYGGYPTCGAASALGARVKRLILLDTLVPEPGKAMFDFVPAANVEEARKTLVDGFRLPNPPNAFFDVPDDGRIGEWLKRRVVGLPWATLSQPFTGGLPDKAITPVDFIQCTGAKFAVAGKLGRMAAEAQGWTVHEMAAGHNVMMTDPVLLADKLLSLA